MHESTLARRLLGVALDASQRAGGARVRGLRGTLAETETLSRDALQFHFDALSVGTAAEGARLELAIEHVAARCLRCGCVYLPEQHLLLCPDCGSTEGAVLGLPGLRVHAVEVEACEGSD